MVGREGLHREVLLFASTSPFARAGRIKAQTDALPLAADPFSGRIAQHVAMQPKSPQPNASDERMRP